MATLGRAVLLPLRPLIGNDCIWVLYRSPATDNTKTCVLYDIHFIFKMLGKKKTSVEYFNTKCFLSKGNFSCISASAPVALIIKNVSQCRYGLYPKLLLYTFEMFGFVLNQYLDLLNDSIKIMKCSSFKNCIGRK